MAALQRYYNHHQGHVYRIIDVTGSVSKDMYKFSLITCHWNHISYVPLLAQLLR